MALPVACLLILLATALPVCEPGALEGCGLLLLAEVNAERLAAGLAPLEVQPVLDAVARDRAREIAGGGSVDPSLERLQATTRRLYRDGYVPHDWTESALVGRWGGGIFGQWREVVPRWYDEVRTGDYEHVGIGVAQIGGRPDGQPVFALVFGLSKRTMEWRLAAPLAELARVRGEMLREVNTLRREKGRAALRRNPLLDLAAQSHAEDMLRRSYYDHRSPEGGTVRSRVREAGLGRAATVSENLAKGLFTPAEAVRRWMASSGHRRNILSPGARELGSGVAFGENDNGFEVVWVQVFASAPRGPR